jgi:hypothetical protein
VLMCIGIGGFIVLRGMNAEGNPNRGGFGWAAFMMGTCMLSISVFIGMHELIDIILPDLVKVKDWLPTIISGTIGFVVLIGVCILDRNSDMYILGIRNREKSK